MEDFKLQVKKGFQKCRSDIEVVNTSNSQLKVQVSELKEENLELKGLVQSMNSELNELKAELKGVSIALDYIKNFNNGVEKPIVQSQVVREEIPVKVAEPKKEKPQPQYNDPYEALLAFKAKSNKRELLKQKMISMLEENDGMILSELKFLFVDHYRYCSKASFYNYLKEIELEKYIKIERDSGKNKVFLTRPEIRSRIENEI